MKKINVVAFSALTLIVCCYLILRAIYSPLVFDEATTFFKYVVSNNYVPGFAEWSANNHFLNSLFTNIFYHLFGPEEWVLRIPNLLAFPVFAFYLFKISGYLKYGLAKWTLFLGVFSFHSFLEMFAYCRGYGLSFAFLAASIYYLLKAINNQKGWVYQLLLFQVLMLLSNLNLLPIAFLTFAIVAGLFFQQKIISLKSITYGLVSLANLSFATWWSLKLKELNLLYYNSEHGLWYGTIKSLVHTYVIPQFVNWQWWLIVFFIGLVVVLFFYPKHKIKKEQILLLSLAAAPWLFFIALNLILHINPPLERTVLYTPFLILLTLVFFLDRGAKFPLFFVAVFYITPGAYGFIDRMNLRNATAFVWEKEQIPDSFFETVLNSNENATVGGYFLRKLCWEYLNFKSDSKINVLQIKDYPSNIADYQVVEKKLAMRKLDDYQIIIKDSFSTLCLIKRKQPRQVSLLGSKSFKEEISNQKTVDFLKTEVNNAKAYLVDLEFTLKSKDENFNGIIIYSVKDKDDNGVLFGEVKLNQMYAHFLEEESVKQTFYIAGLPEGSHRVEVFLWNVKARDMSLKDVKVSFSELENTLPKSENKIEIE